MDVSKLTKDLSDSDLAELNDGIQAEVRARRPKVFLEDIKPGMSKEEDARVRAAIKRGVDDLLAGR